jgi:hypothetical protein
MKMNLSKNRPTDSSKEEFEKSWINIGYTLSALYKTIEDYIVSTDTVKEDDFSIPNHYALLAYQAGKRAAYQEIINLLPDTAK